MKASPAPGEVWTVDFGYDAKVRSALVVSIPDKNCRLAISTVVQITTQYAGDTIRSYAAPRSVASRAKLL